VPTIFGFDLSFEEASLTQRERAQGNGVSRDSAGRRDIGGCFKRGQHTHLDKKMYDVQDISMATPECII
jgi:hypothetical protein